MSFSLTITVLFSRVKFLTLPLTRNLSIKLLPSSSFWRAVPTEKQSSALTLLFPFCDMRPVENANILFSFSDSSKSAVSLNQHKSLVNAAIFLRREDLLRSEWVALEAFVGFLLLDKSEIASSILSFINAILLRVAVHNLWADSWVRILPPDKPPDNFAAFVRRWSIDRSVHTPDHSWPVYRTVCRPTT